VGTAGELVGGGPLADRQSAAERHVQKSQKGL